MGEKQAGYGGVAMPGPRPADILLPCRARPTFHPQIRFRQRARGHLLAPSELIALRIAVAVLLGLCVLGASRAALAYRPFDGTDAAVVGPGEFEVELGPAGYLRQGADRALIAPALTLNYGFAPRWEAVVEGQAVHGFSAGNRQSSLVGNGVFLKNVLREGVLQDAPGPSVAAEYGLLLPGIGGEAGTGGSIAGIVSQRWPWLTLHLNAVAAVTRQQHGDLFLGAIIEGPQTWPVRPVAEVFHERDFGQLKTTSVLVGAIWQVSDRLAFDVGLRRAWVNDHTVDELRLGVTFGFQTR